MDEDSAIVYICTYGGCGPKASLRGTQTTGRRTDPSHAKLVQLSNFATDVRQEADSERRPHPVTFCVFQFGVRSGCEWQYWRRARRVLRSTVPSSLVSSTLCPCHYSTVLGIGRWQFAVQVTVRPGPFCFVNFASSFPSSCS